MSFLGRKWAEGARQPSASCGRLLYQHRYYCRIAYCFLLLAYSRTLITYYLQCVRSSRTYALTRGWADRVHPRLKPLESMCEHRMHMYNKQIILYVASLSAVLCAPAPRYPQLKAGDYFAHKTQSVGFVCPKRKITQDHLRQTLNEHGCDGEQAF